MRALRQLFAAWLDTLKAIAGDKGVLLIMGLAPPIYGFFYPWPYAQQSVTRVPVAVVDYDHSSLSRQITRFAQASPRVDVRLLTGDEGEAQPYQHPAGSPVQPDRRLRQLCSAGGGAADHPADPADHPADPADGRWHAGGPVGRNRSAAR